MPEHKGTTPPKVKSTSQAASGLANGEDAGIDDDEDDPLDKNITYSRNLQREWQDVFAQSHGQKLTDFNYRNAGSHLAKEELHWATIWVWKQV